MINVSTFNTLGSQAVSFNELKFINSGGTEAIITFTSSGDSFELLSKRTISISAFTSTSDTIDISFKDNNNIANELQLVWIDGVGGGPGIDTNIYNIDGTLTDNLRTLSGDDKDLTFDDVKAFRQNLNQLLSIITQSPFNTDFFSSIVTNTSSVTLRGVNDDDVTEGKVIAAEDSSEIKWIGFSRNVGLENNLSRSYLVFNDSNLNRTSFLELTDRKAEISTSTGTAPNITNGKINIDSLSASLDIQLNDPLTSDKRILLDSGGILIESDELKIDIPSADTVGKVLAVTNTSTKEVEFVDVSSIVNNTVFAEQDETTDVTSAIWSTRHIFSGILPIGTYEISFFTICRPNGINTASIQNGIRINNILEYNQGFTLVLGNEGFFNNTFLYEVTTAGNFDIEGQFRRFTAGTQAICSFSNMIIKKIL